MGRIIINKTPDRTGTFAPSDRVFFMEGSFYSVMLLAVLEGL